MLMSLSLSIIFGTSLPILRNDFRQERSREQHWWRLKVLRLEYLILKTTKVEREARFDLNRSELHEALSYWMMPNDIPTHSTLKRLEAKKKASWFSIFLIAPHPPFVMKFSFHKVKSSSLKGTFAVSRKSSNHITKYSARQISDGWMKKCDRM